MIERLQQWCIDNKLSFQFHNNAKCLEIIGFGRGIIIAEKLTILDEEDENEKLYLFDKEMCLLLDDEEEYLINNSENLQYYIFEWGGNFYYHSIVLYHKITKPSLLLNVGTANLTLDFVFNHLGVRGEYEILNGMQSYDKWCKKAVFYGQKSLGICEKHTLAGALAFQLECKGAGLKSIIGETVNFRFDNKDFEVKLYAINNKGWKNLLRINNFINVERNEEKYIDVLELNQNNQLNTQHLFCIISNLTTLSCDLITTLKQHFQSNLYYQFDVSEFSSNERDITLLNNLKVYIDQYIHLLPYAFIIDSFYTEKVYGFMKKKLNGVGKFSTTESKDQYFKSAEDLYIQMLDLFKSSAIDFDQFFITGIDNVNYIADQCNMVIDLKFLKIPKYLFKIEEREGEDLFYHLIQQGLEQKILPYCQSDEELQVYIDRIETELEVINEGGFQDYFLILYDILSWCKGSDILYGNGRGCFLPNSKILLANGQYKMLNEIKIGDLLVGEKEINEVQEIFTYSIKEEMIHLVFENGSEIKCTKDHKIFTSNRGYVEADKLTETDSIVYVQN